MHVQYISQSNKYYNRTEMTQLQHNSKDFQVRKTEEFQLDNKLIDLQSFTLFQKNAPKNIQMFY